MTEQTSFTTRVIFYVFGFLVMTMGIAISVKSGLGVSPVSSIPYTITCLIALPTLGSVGIGTVISSMLVGSLLKVITKYFRPARDRIPHSKVST
jgi:uncharacterized membrane protein YczE